jgi:hypothetical protein
VAVGNGILFLFGWPGALNQGQLSLSYREIADHDRYYRELRAFLRGEHDAEPVRILATASFADGLRSVQAALPDRPGQVAQAVQALPKLPRPLQRLDWLRLMTPDQVIAEGRAVYAVARAPWMIPENRVLFGDRFRPVEIGPGHYLLRLERE